MGFKVGDVRALGEKFQARAGETANIVSWLHYRCEVETGKEADDEERKAGVRTS
jgi:hypothetical protein